MTEIIPLEHSEKYPPSGMAGREVCTAPAILSHALDDLPPESFTIEGIAVHHVLEVCLKTERDAWEFIGDDFSQGEHEVVFSQEMAGEIQPVIDKLRSIVDDIGIAPNVEARLTLPDFPEMFGTSDFWFDNGGQFTVVDLKFGFILIEPDAFQLVCYLLMAILTERGVEHITEGDPDEVIGITGVAQPRAFGVDLFRTHRWTRADLQKQHQRLREAIYRIEQGTLIWHAGDHCRYCKIAPACPKLAQVAKDAAIAELIHDPSLEMTGADIDEAYAMLPALRTYIKRIQEFGQKYLEAGGDLDNVKLVKKRATREWRDPAAARAFLEQHEVDPYTSEMKSPAQAEKDLTKSARPKLGQFVSKRSSGLTVAGRDDPRGAVPRKVSDETRRRARIAAEKLNTRTRKGA